MFKHRKNCRSSHLNKEDEVFEGCVEVSLLLQLHDRVKVLVVDVSVDSEQALQYGLCHRHEVSLKRDTLGEEENQDKCYNLRATV